MLTKGSGFNIINIDANLHKKMRIRIFLCGKFIERAFMRMRRSALSYERFIKNKIGADIIKALEDALKSGKSGGRVILVFMCRKAYWLYRLYRMNKKNWDEEYGDVVIVTNRYVLKERKMPISEYDTIIIFDDTVSSGRSVKAAYDDIRRMHPNVTVKVKIAFSAHSKLEIKETLQKEANDESLASFFDNLEIYRVLLPDEMGWVSTQEILMFQESGIPYVVELPLVRDAQNADESNDYYAIDLSASEFEKMKKVGGFWSYVDYSYDFRECMTEGAYHMTKIHSGFFWYKDPNLNVILGQNAIQLIVKCTYSEYGNGRLKAVFTPFAVMNSMYFDDVWDMFCTLYEKTSYLKEEQIFYKEYMIYRKKGTGKFDKEYFGQLENQLGTVAYRAVVFFLSMYVFSLFRKMTDGILNQTMTVIDETHMREVYTSKFIKYVKEMEQWKPEDFFNKIKKLNVIVPVPLQNKFVHTKFQDKKIGIEEIVAQIRLEVLEKKDRLAGRKELAIEEIRDYVYMQLGEAEQNKKECMLIVSILQLLDQSIIGNSLWIEDGIVRRGFRYGENSDIIPLFGTTPYVQILMQDLYFFYIWGNTDRREESYQWFKNATRQLFKELRKKKKEDDILDRYISDEQLEYDELYYCRDCSDVGMMIRNKNCFSSINCSDTIKSVLENWLSCFADSWI